MSIRTSSSSSGAVDTTTPATAAPRLKEISGYVDSCTYVKQKDTSNEYGCYLFRSCQSCLEISGCMVNDLGICVSSVNGMKNLQSGRDQYGTSYYSEMNYLLAIKRNLSLPAAVSTNKAALAAEQNWHFRAGEATYCAANDAVCQDCKKNNFWSASELSDSRFCVGANGCVCIQTCEVPSFKTPGCQWKLSTSSDYGYGYGYGYGYDHNSYYTYPTEHLRLWEWLIVLLVVIVVHALFKCCGSSKESQLKAAREEAVLAVRQELGIPENEPTLAPVRQPVPRRTETEVTDDSSVHDEVKTPRDAAATDSQAVFVEIEDASAPPQRTNI